LETKTPNTDERIGLFGGTFNPLHVGHINCITTVRQRLGFDKIVVIPAAQNPKKLPVEGPSPEQRLEMLRVGLQEFDYVEIDDLELKRGGPSYSVDTVAEYGKRVPSENLYLIIGMDQFEQFDQWKDFERILTLSNLVVVTRTGHQIPFSADELPEGLKKLVAAFDRNFIALTTGRTIDFVRLSDIDVSASEVRKRLRTGRNVDKYLTIPVEELIREKQMYGPLKDRIGDYELFTRFCADRLADRKAINIRGFDLREIDAPTEFTLVASGTSTRHVSSLAENLVREIKEEYNVLPQSSEGMSEGRWVLLDYGSLIVHLFYDYVRQEYRIEELWKKGRALDFGTEATAEK
jgi:nicotinate-nucleotide adenylyltransferase